MSKLKYRMRTPLLAGGIRAQDGRLSDVREWWARKWRMAIEGMEVKSRLGRGRNYAASGQVTRLELEGSRVTASVVGTRETPYEVEFRFREPEGESRSRIVAALRAEPILVARLLAEDLPTEIEELFRAEGFTLFPGGKLAPGKYDVTTKCSCPDWANPCKHSGAVLLLLGEEIARRPATLLELRGIALEELYDED